MKHLALAATLFATPALAAEPLVVAQQYAAALDKGDMKTADALLVASPAITDELPPFQWQGPAAARDWLAAYGAFDKQEGITDEKIATGAPIREEIAGGAAYVILSATYSFRQKGETRREAAQWTFALTRAASGWKIAAWTWTAPRAAPALP